MASRSTDAEDAASRLDVPLLLVLPPQHLVAHQAVDLRVLHRVYSLALGPGVLENLFSPPRVPGKSCEFLVGGRLALALADGEVEEVQHGAARVPPWCSSLGNRSGNRSCGSVREKANCGLQEHAHGLPESPMGAHRGCPTRAASPRGRVLNHYQKLRPEASPDPSPQAPRRRIRRRTLESGDFVGRPMVQRKREAGRLRGPGSGNFRGVYAPRQPLRPIGQPSDPRKRRGGPCGAARALAGERGLLEA